MMNSPGILALSIYKPSGPSGGTAYQLDGSKIAVDSEGYICERNIIDTAKGTERKKNAKHTFEIRHSDSSFQSTFLADADAGNRSWNLVIAELDGFVLWYEDSNVNCTIEEAYIDPNNEGFPYVIRMTSYGSAIARGTNLLYAYAKTQGFASAWQDSDSNNIPDGWVDGTGGLTQTFSGGQFSLSGSSGSGHIDIKITFPITGIDLTHSANNIQTHSNASNRIGILYYNYSISLLTIQQTVYSSTGRVSQTATSPSNTYQVWFRLARLESITGAGTSIISNPSVRLNDSTEYVDG